MFTQTEAELKICPMTLQRGDHCCVGKRCMAWVWGTTENEFVKAHPIKTSTQTLPEEKHIIRNLVQTSMFPRPGGKGWEASGEPAGPKSKDSSLWTQDWTREQSFADAERKGDCGLKGK